MKLTAENGIEVLGKLIQGYPDSVNNDYYGSGYYYYGYAQLLKKLVGSVVDPYNVFGVSIVSYGSSYN